jgi:hypothetical protein
MVKHRDFTRSSSCRVLRETVLNSQSRGITTLSPVLCSAIWKRRKAWIAATAIGSFDLSRTSGMVQRHVWRCRAGQSDLKTIFAIDVFLRTSSRKLSPCLYPRSRYNFSL